MTGCPAFADGASIAAALRGVDCMTGQATAFAFGRLFGADGRLLTALTLLMTLYVAAFAVGLLTGRTRAGVATLTPRMLTLGLVLTFATSWVAYQQVVWTLAAGAPDQVASVVTGTKGSATAAFADRLDRLFDDVQAIAEAASRKAPPTETGVTPAAATVGGFSSATVLWLSALMLLLGTVGVLVTAKIALAAMLALGPLFIVLALFPATRGLFEGWAKAVVLFALVPMLAVLIGGGAVLALDPVVRAIDGEGAQPDARGVATLFCGAAVYLCLMAMAVKTATTLVAGWRMPGRREGVGASGTAAHGAAAAIASHATERALVATGEAGRLSPAVADPRVRGIVAALPAPASEDSRVRLLSAGARTAPVIVATDADAWRAPRRDARIAGVGGRFRPRPTALTKEHIA